MKSYCQLLVLLLVGFVPAPSEAADRPPNDTPRSTMPDSFTALTKRSDG